MPKTKRAAIYARVSTLNGGQDPEMQTRELREYCDRRGWEVIGEYVDRGISGAKDSRPQLNRLMEDAHKHLYEIAICWKLIDLLKRLSSTQGFGNLPGAGHRICLTD